VIDIDNLERLARAAPSGQWEVWTSNSWRRVYANQGRDQVRVIEPAVQHDRWPDLMFGEGVKEWLEGVTPDAVLDLIAEVRRLRADRNVLLAACRSAVLPLAYVADEDATYQQEYEALSAAIEVATKELA
jgi:hypothetical protein